MITISMALVITLPHAIQDRTSLYPISLQNSIYQNSYSYINDIHHPRYPQTQLPWFYKNTLTIGIVDKIM